MTAPPRQRILFSGKSLAFVHSPSRSAGFRHRLSAAVGTIASSGKTSRLVILSVVSRRMTFTWPRDGGYTYATPTTRNACMRSPEHWSWSACLASGANGTRQTPTGGPVESFAMVGHPAAWLKNHPERQLLG